MPDVDISDVDITDIDTLDTAASVVGAARSTAASLLPDSDEDRVRLAIERSLADFAGLPPGAAPSPHGSSDAVAGSGSAPAREGCWQLDHGAREDAAVASAHRRFDDAVARRDKEEQQEGGSSRARI
eukprot:gene5079-938_t